MNTTRIPGTYSNHDDDFMGAVGSLRKYLDAVVCDEDEGHEYRDAAVAAITDLVARDVAEHATADDTFAAFASAGLPVPDAIRDLVDH